MNRHPHGLFFLLIILSLIRLPAAVPYDSTGSAPAWQGPGELRDTEGAGPDSSRRLPPDSVRVTVHPDSLAMRYGDRVSGYTPAAAWEYEPGIRPFRVTAYGQGAFLQADGAWVRAGHLLIDGMPWYGGGDYACDMERVPLYPAAAITAPGRWGFMRLDSPGSHPVLPYTQIDFQQNSFLPFLGITEIWRTGGVRFYKSSGPFDFHLTYRSTENVVRNYDLYTCDVAGAGGRTAAVTYTHRKRVKIRLYTGDFGYTHDADTAVCRGYTQTEPTGIDYAGLDVHDDSTGLAVQGRLTGIRVPRRVTYLYLADTSSGYAADVRISRRWDLPGFNQRVDGIFHYRYEKGDYSGEKTGQSVPELDVRYTACLRPTLTVASRLAVSLSSFAPAEISPGMEAVWQPAPGLRAAVKAWRESYTPMLYERVCEDTLGYPVWTGNTGLVPEKLDGIRAGLDIAPAGSLLTVRLHAFGRYGTGYIQPEWSSGGLTRVNIDRTLHYGAAAALRFRPAGGWQADLHYRYAVVKDRDADTDLLYHPRQYLRLGGGYGRAFYDGVLTPRATVTVRGEGKGYGYHAERARTADVPAYCVLDFLLETGILDAVLFFRTENLLDLRYHTVPGTTMPGRLYRMGIHWFFWN